MGWFNRSHLASLPSDTRWPGSLRRHPRKSADPCWCGPWMKLALGRCIPRWPFLSLLRKKWPEIIWNHQSAIEMMQVLTEWVENIKYKGYIFVLSSRRKQWFLPQNGIYTITLCNCKIALKSTYFQKCHMTAWMFRFHRRFYMVVPISAPSPTSWTPLLLVLLGHKVSQ